MQNDELRRDQLELEVAHERLVDLYDFAPVGYVTLDAKGLVSGANLTAATLLGRERKGLVGRRFASAVASRDSDRWHRFVMGLHQQGERAACKVTMARGDGSTFDALLSCELRTSGPAGSSVRIVLTDVTELALLERALRETKERLSHVIDGSNDGFWDWNVQSGHVAFSRRWASMFGYDLAELEPGIATLERLLHADDRARAMPALQAHVRGETEHVEVEGRVRHKDGHWVWTLLRGKAVERDANGSPIRAAGTITDVSDRKAAEQVLAESEERFRELVASLAEGLVVQGLDGSVTTCNPAAERLLGLPAQELCGRKSVDPRWRAVHADGRPFPGETHPAMVALRTGVPQPETVMGIHRPDGTLTWLQVNADVLRDAAGAVFGARSTFVDITARRQAETERNALQGRLALASRLTAMGTLVTGVAHEINNPLAAAISDQEMALLAVREVHDRLAGDDPLDRKAAARTLDSVVEELVDAQIGGHRIAQIVRDLSAFGRPDSRRGRVRLMDVVDQAMRWLPATVGQSATLRVENGGAPDVLASFGQIEQVVVNLVTNAAKATKQGKSGAIIIRLLPGSPGMARLDVIDQGVGIEPVNLDRIFEPFFTNSVVGQGAGLGLSISHAIVRAHGGTLTVESVVDRGSTFRMELPAAPAGPDGDTLPG
jgi:PAS domain S-box-containing protein